MIRNLKPGELVPIGEPRRYRNSSGYIRLRWQVGPGEYVERYEHRVFDGVVTDAEHVHHVNGDRTDNRRENLRRLTAREHADEHAADHAAEIADRYKAGESSTVLGVAFGIHPSAVTRLLDRRGIARRTPAENRRARIDYDAIRLMHAQGIRVAPMAALLGLHREVVTRALDELGLPRFRPGRPARQVRQCSPTRDECTDATPCLACPWQET